MGDAPEKSAGADAESYFNEGLDAHDRGDLDKAREAYLKAVEIEPSMVVAYNNLGMVYIDNGMFDEAIEVLQQTLRLDPSYAEAYNNLGFVYRRKGEDLSAVEQYEKFLELEPAVEDAPKIRAWMEKVRASQPEAPPPVAQAAPPVPAESGGFGDLAAGARSAGAPAQTGESPQAVIARAYQHFDDEDYERSLAEFRKAVALAPQDGAAHAGLGRTLSRLGQYDEAVVQLQKATLFNPADALNHYALGNSLKALGRNEEAASSFERFLGIMPEAEDAGEIRAWIDQVRGVAAPAQASPADEIYHKALMEFQDGELDAALATCEQALATDENNFQASLLLGRILLRKKDFLRAVAVLSHTSEIRPDNAETYFFLGQAYEKRGLHDEARRAYEKCLEVAPDGPQAARVSEWLWRAKQAGKTALGLRCEYCFRSFAEEELSFHEGKRICNECAANLGVAPTGAPEGWQSALAFAPSEAAAEEGVGALGWAGRVAGVLLFLVLLSFLLFLVFAWVGILGPAKLEAWGVSPALTALGLDGFLGKLGVKLHSSSNKGQQIDPLQPEVPKAIHFETQPPRKAVPLLEYVYVAKILGGRPASYSLAMGPPGAKIDESTGRFRWMPSEIGTFSVEISARSGGATGIQTFEVEVALPVIPAEPIVVSRTPGERHLLLSADLTGDGLEDLVVCKPGEVIVLRHTESHSLEAIELPGEIVFPVAATAADVDGDGTDELLAIDWYSSILVCWKWDKRENFVVKHAVPTIHSPDALAAGKLDGDDLEDLVVAGWGVQVVQAFAGSSQSPPGKPQQAECGTGTGMNSLAIVSSPLGERAVLVPGLAPEDEARVFGVASGKEILGKFRSASGIGGKPVGAAVGDFGTGKQLALLYGGRTGRMVLMGFDEAGTDYEKKETVSLDPHPIALAAGDMNGDRVDDLVVVYPQKLKMYLRRLPEGFTPIEGTEVVGAWGPACCADLNGDGRKDIAVICFNGTLRVVHVGQKEG